MWIIWETRSIPISNVSQCKNMHQKLAYYIDITDVQKLAKVQKKRMSILYMATKSYTT